MIEERRFKVTYGDPSSLENITVTGDGIAVEPVDGSGTRRLTAWTEGDDGETQNKFEMTVGPDHVIGWKEWEP